MMRSLALTLFVCTAAAQQGPPVLPGKFRVPLHTAPADPLRGAYGTWAVGHDYKASFHDGFRCYPRLGRSAPRNLPLAWQTCTVLSGSRPLFEQADRRGAAAGDWRYEFRHPGVTEAYELRADGVDQTFTIQSVPAANADLTVVGTIDTLLVPQAQSWAQAVLWADANRVVRLSLGTARATDARGRNVPLQRTWDRGQLRLLVRAVDLAAVTWPLVLSQLVAPTGLLVGNEYSDVDFARWDGEGYIAVTSHWSAPDADSHGFKLTELWALGVFWADVSADWSTERVRIDTGPTAHVRVAAQRTHAAPAVSEVFVYHQHAPATTAVVNTGTWAWAPATAGYTQRNPELDSAGFAGITMTWQEDFTSVNADTATTRVCAAAFDGLSNSFPVKWIVAGEPLIDAQDAIMRGGHVFWQQQPSSAASPPQIWARALDAAGPVAAPAVHVSAAHSACACRHPRVAAWYPFFEPRNLCSYEFADGAERGIAAVKLIGSSVVTTHELWRSTQPARLHDVVTGPSPMLWYVLHERAGVLHGTRLGNTGGTVADFLIDSGSAACACLGPVWGTAQPGPTPVLFARAASPDLVWMSTMTLSPLAQVSTYGSGCGGSLTDTPFGYGQAVAYAGGEVVLAVTGPSSGTPCQLWMANAQGSTPLTGGCTFLLDASAVTALAFAFSTSSPGGYLLRLPLPDDPVFLGNLDFQVTWPDAAMPWVIRATNGVEARVH